MRRVFISAFSALLTIAFSLTVGATRELTPVNTYTHKFNSGGLNYKVKVSSMTEEDVLSRWFSAGQDVPANISVRKGKEGKELYVYEPKKEAVDAFKLGMSAFNRGEYVSARKQFENSYRLDPKFDKVLLFIGDAYFMVKDYNKAIKYFSELLDKNPVDYKASLFLSDSYAKLGKLEEAKKYLVRSLILNVRNGEAWGKLRRLGDFLGFEVENYRLIPLAYLDEKTKSLVIANEAWTHYGTCKGVWQNDKGFFKNKTGLDKYRLTIAEELECSINLVKGLNDMSGKVSATILPESIKRLQNIPAEELYNLVVMELYLPQDPLMASSFSEEEITKLAKYVDTYILVKGDAYKRKLVSKIRREISSTFKTEQEISR